VLSLSISHGSPAFHAVARRPEPLPGIDTVQMRRSRILLSRSRMTDYRLPDVARVDEHVVCDSPHTPEIPGCPSVGAPTASLDLTIIGPRHNGGGRAHDRTRAQIVDGVGPPFTDQTATSLCLWVEGEF
jgi:hypothetical protein